MPKQEWHSHFDKRRTVDEKKLLQQYTSGPGKNESFFTYTDGQKDTDTWVNPQGPGAADPDFVKTLNYGRVLYEQCAKEIITGGRRRDGILKGSDGDQGYADPPVKDKKGNPVYTVS